MSAGKGSPFLSIDRVPRASSVASVRDRAAISQVALPSRRRRGLASRMRQALVGEIGLRLGAATGLTLLRGPRDRCQTQYAPDEANPDPPARLARAHSACLRRACLPEIRLQDRHRSQRNLLTEHDRDRQRRL
jgi:hypothetical protein